MGPGLIGKGPKRIVPKKLTITVNTEVYDGLHRVIGRRRISRFLNDFARPDDIVRVEGTSRVQLGL